MDRSGHPQTRGPPQQMEPTAIDKVNARLTLLGLTSPHTPLAPMLTAGLSIACTVLLCCRRCTTRLWE